MTIMRLHLAVTGVCFLLTLAAAAALEVGAYYAPATPVGAARGWDTPLSLPGFGADVGWARWRGFGVASGVFFNELAYGRPKLNVTVYIPPVEVPTLALYGGVNYDFLRGAVTPAAGAGGVFAAAFYRFEEHYGEPRTEFAPGFYLNGGARFRLADKWSLFCGTRYIYLFGNIIYENAGSEPLRGTNAQVVDFPVGVAYTF